MKSVFLFLFTILVLNAFFVQPSNAQIRSHKASSRKVITKRSNSKIKPKVRFINPATLSKPPGYTHVVEVMGGRTIYIAGQIALDSSGKVVERSDFRAQAEQVFANLKLALESVGATFKDVIKLNMYANQ